MNNLISKIGSETYSPFPWNKMKEVIESLLYPTTTFILPFTFETRTRADGGSDTVAKISPQILFGIIPHLQHVEIEPEIKVLQDRISDTLSLTELANAMPSLKEQLSKLESSSIVLKVYCSSITDQEAKTNVWTTGPAVDGPISSEPNRVSLPRIHDKICQLLQAAKNKGPGKIKTFKLVVARSGFVNEPQQWEPWFRRSIGIELQSVDDFKGVLQKAIDNSTEKPMDWVDSPGLDWSAYWKGH